MSDTIKTRSPKVNFASDQDVRWCPGCGDYAILAQMKKILPDLGVERENVVFVSGIGCASRFPYYLNTYGLHTIHGRAPAVATGVKVANPELTVFMITGDGDSLSIGGNHLMHICRRNVDVNIILFNNQIYGLTKGQYSPTSPVGKVTKTTPYGSLDTPFNPLSLVLSAGAGFVARTVDRDTKHMAETFRKAAAHKGTSFVEVYQNCNIFNDGAFKHLTDPENKLNYLLYLEDGEPLIYGNERSKGVRMNGLALESIEVTDDEADRVHRHSTRTDSDIYPYMLTRMSEDPALPTPVGVFHQIERPTYEDLLHQQVADVTKQKGRGDLKDLFITGNTWTVD
ncbi:MAG: 2-oxoacid:ferredoxin oxidoreductase subunit beta [Calditrichia bacterium]